MILLFIILFIILYILNYLDGYSTYIVLKNSSVNNEKNPFARWIIKKMGIKKGIITIKSLIILITPFILYYAYYDMKGILIVLGISNILYILVVINNFKQIKKIKR